MDETYPSRGEDSYLAIAALCLYKSHLRSHCAHVRSLAQLGLPKQTDAVVSWLRTVKVTGCIIRTRKSELLASPAIRHWYSDIGHIAAANDLWTTFACTGIGYAIRLALKAGWRVDYLHIYHDSKSLAAAHQSAFVTLLPKVIALWSRGLAGGKSQQAVPQLRNVRSIKKPSSAASSSPEQVGTWLADRLAKMPQLLSANPLPHCIRVADLTHLAESWTWGEN